MKAHTVETIAAFSILLCVAGFTLATHRPLPKVLHDPAPTVIVEPEPIPTVPPLPPAKPEPKKKTPKAKKHTKPAPKPVSAFCEKVLWAKRNLPPGVFEFYVSLATPEQIAAGKKCLKDAGY